MNKVIILLLMIIVVSISCGDNYITYTMHIDNQTRDTIKIVFFDKSPYKMLNSDSLFFPPECKKLLYDGIGRILKNNCDYTGINEDEIEIYTTSGKKIRKNIWDVSNWKCSGDKKEGWDMTYCITEQDLD